MQPRVAGGAKRDQHPLLIHAGGVMNDEPPLRAGGCRRNLDTKMDTFRDSIDPTGDKARLYQLVLAREIGEKSEIGGNSFERLRLKLNQRQ
jgi:hypothetical protein